MKIPVRRQIPRRGPINSHDFNEALSSFADAEMRLRERIDDTDRSLDRRRVDDALSRGAGVSAGAELKLKERTAEAYSLWSSLNDETPVEKIYTFYGSDYIHYVVDQGSSVEGYVRERRLALDTRYGQLTLPFTGVKSAFWTPATEEAGDIVLEEVQVQVQDASSLSARITHNDPRNAFDATSKDPFLIRASYPLNTNIDEVVLDINILLPRSVPKRVNMISLDPAPEMACNIVGIKYSDASIIANNDIPGMPVIDANNPLYDIEPQRFFFDPVEVLSLQIRLSSKSFIYENGRKVFYLGFREVGLFEVDSDATWANTGAGVFTNNGVFVKMELPIVDGISPNVTLDEITGLRTNPQVATVAGASGTNTGVRIRVYEDDALSTQLYDSLLDGVVSDASPIVVGGDRTHVWLNIELDRNNALNILPVLKSLLVEYKVK